MEIDSIPYLSVDLSPSSLYPPGDLLLAASAASFAFCLLEAAFSFSSSAFFRSISSLISACFCARFSWRFRT